MCELDEKNGKNGCELEELHAHRFLEAWGVSTFFYCVHHSLLSPLSLSLPPERKKLSAY